MTNRKADEGFTPLDPAPLSRVHARVHLSDDLISLIADQAAKLARKDRLLGKPLSIEQFADRVIRATVGAINLTVDDQRYRDWEFEKLAIAQLDDDQAQQSFDRWKAGASV
ncbi:hypothetical protein [Paraburkholderia sp. D1E]|uniref:hypothetical protein n=1 Tax=Paraburkholderia sp. D1E TaxID=3461398 RepID=UPI0040466F72